MTQRPNILVIMTDQQRWDAMSCAGAPVPTPACDRLAASGMSFSHAFVQSPLCLPSRLSMANGQYVHQHRVFVNEHPLDSHVPTWPQRLHDGGYRVRTIGRTDFVYGNHFQVPEPYHDFVDLQQQQFTWPHGRHVEAQDIILDEHYDGLVAKQAGDYITNMVKCLDGKPWGMHVGFFAPHPPYRISREFHHLMDPALYDDAPFQAPAENLPRGQHIFYENYVAKLRPDERQRMRAGYWASVAMADACIGRVLDALDASGQADDTMVCLVSDHGDHNLEHGLISKFLGAYDSETRVPFVWRWPGQIPENTQRDDLVECIDLVATIYDAAEVGSLHECQGKSLLPLMRGEKDGEVHRDAVFSVTGWMGMDKVRPEGHMVRTRTHKLVYYPLAKSELYDLEKDPQETRNYFDDPAYAEIQAALQKRLLDFLITENRAPIEDKYRHMSGYPQSDCEVKRPGARDNAI